jgi:arginyl-tRNA synthetase
VCAALHELANAYAGFYQACPVLKAADARTRLSRLRLSALTQRVLAGGLDLLGIAAPDRM